MTLTEKQYKKEFNDLIKKNKKIIMCSLFTRWERIKIWIWKIIYKRNMDYSDICLELYKKDIKSFQRRINKSLKKGDFFTSKKIKMEVIK